MALWNIWTPLLHMLEGSHGTPARAPALLAEYMDRLDSDGRYALIKLATGAMRVGISARLATTAFAQAFGLAVDAVEEVWHALAPPYASLFAWGEGGPRPDPEGTPYFRPFMIAHPLEDGTVDLADYAAEWKWDGIRIQIVRIGEQVKLFSRGGDDITLAFPDIAQHMPVEGVFDGELLVRGEAQMGEAASFNALQQRLGRKTVSAKMLAEAPAFVRLYDLLIDGREDLRTQPWHVRRARLEAKLPALPADRFDLSQIIEAADFAELGRIRDGAQGHVQCGAPLARGVDGQAYGPRRVAEAVARPAARTRQQQQHAPLHGPVTRTAGPPRGAPGINGCRQGCPQRRRRRDGHAGRHLLVSA